MVWGNFVVVSARHDRFVYVLRFVWILFSVEKSQRGVVTAASPHVVDVVAKGEATFAKLESYLVLARYDI
jgi:hypothetical protein